MNHWIILCTSLLRFILRVESNSMNVSKWCLMDPIRSKWHESLDLLACAICAWIFKGERVIVSKWLSVVYLVMCEVAIVLQSKSIKLLRDVATGPNLSLTTDHIFLCRRWFSLEQDQFCRRRQAFASFQTWLPQVWRKCFPSIFIYTNVYGKMLLFIIFWFLMYGW